MCACEFMMTLSIFPICKPPSWGPVEKWSKCGVIMLLLCYYEIRLGISACINCRWDCEGLENGPKTEEQEIKYLLSHLYGSITLSASTQTMHCHFVLFVSTNITYFPFRNLLISWIETSLLSLRFYSLSHIPPSTPPPLSKVTVPPQRPLLCGASPPPAKQMEGQASHSHRAIFSQPSALVLPLTSPSSSSFLSLRPGWRSVVHLVGTPAVRCCKDSTQQVHACVSDCWDCFTMPLLMKPGQLSDLCPLFWPEI